MMHFGRCTLCRTGLTAIFIAISPIAAQSETEQSPPPPLSEGVGLPVKADRASPDDPMTLIVSLDKQRIQLFRGADRFSTSRISSGQKGYPTPAGIFNIVQKRKWHRSNIYSDAPMPFMQRLTWSGIALHAGHVPNYPASHGCIRLPNEFAQSLFRKTEIGVHVVVAGDMVRPVKIEHPMLPQPAPRSVSTVSHVSLSSSPADEGDVPPVPLRTISDLRKEIALAALNNGIEPELAAIGPSDEPLRVLLTKRTGAEKLKDVQTMLFRVGYDPEGIDGYMGAGTWKAIKAFQEEHNLTADGELNEEFLIALHKAAAEWPMIEGHLYVRRGFKKIFDAPVVLRDPGKPLGTHLFTAMDFEEDEKAEWTAVTSDLAEGDDAGTALGRFDIPENIRKGLAQLLTPGSSILISDLGLGTETRDRGTDFVVLTPRKAETDE